MAIYAAYKCIELGAKVITLSDSGGYHIVEEGMTKEMVDAIDDIKVVKKGRLHEYKNDKGEPCSFYPHPLTPSSPWGHARRPSSLAFGSLTFCCRFCFMSLHHEARLLPCAMLRQANLDMMSVRTC